MKLYCPSLYFSLYAWERDHLDSTFLLDLIPSPMADLGTFSETISEGSNSIELRVEPTPLPETTQETVTIDQPSIFSLEDSSISPGFRELDFSDHSLDRMMTSLVPTYREAYGPIPIPTYLGKKVMNKEEPSGALGESTCEGGILGKTMHGRRAWGMSSLLSKLGVLARRLKLTIHFLRINYQQTLNRWSLEA